MYSEIVQTFRNKAVQKDLTDMNTSVMQLLEVREECASVTRALEAQKEVAVWKIIILNYSSLFITTVYLHFRCCVCCCQEMQMKRQSLRERDENIKKEEEKLKKSILKYNKFLQVNQYSKSITRIWMDNFLVGLNFLCFSFR